MVASSCDHSVTTPPRSMPRICTGAGAALLMASVLAMPIAHAADSLSTTDSHFLKTAAQGGAAEVAASKLAQTQSSDPAVKAFADQMVTDHTKAGEALKALASSKGLEVPAEPSVMQKGKGKLLGAMKGASFDKRYAAQMEKDHADTVKLFQTASTDAKDPDVKAFATKTLPALEHHWAMAKDLKAETDTKK